MSDPIITALEAAAAAALAKVREAYEQRIAELERELDARGRLAKEEAERLRALVARVARERADAFAERARALDEVKRLREDLRLADLLRAEGERGR